MPLQGLRLDLRLSVSCFWLRIFGAQFSNSLQSRQMRQLRLAFVERPKTFGLEFKRRGDMQTVQRSHSQARAILARQFNAVFKSVVGHRRLQPESLCKVALQRAKHMPRFSHRHLAVEYVLIDGMRPFGAMQGCEPDERARAQPPFR